MYADELPTVTEVVVLGAAKPPKHYHGLSYDTLGYIRAQNWPRAVLLADVADLRCWSCEACDSDGHVMCTSYASYARELLRVSRDAK